MGKVLPKVINRPQVQPFLQNKVNSIAFVARPKSGSPNCLFTSIDCRFNILCLNCKNGKLCHTS